MDLAIAMENFQLNNPDDHILLSSNPIVQASMTDGNFNPDMCDYFDWKDDGEMEFVDPRSPSSSSSSSGSTSGSSQETGTFTNAQADFCEFLDNANGDVAAAMGTFQLQDPDSHILLMDTLKLQLVDGRLPASMCDHFEWNDEGEMEFVDPRE